MSEANKWGSLILEFVGSLYHGRISQEAQIYSQSILESLAEWAKEQDITPHAWEPMDLKHFCLFDLPKYTFEEKAYFQSVDSVLYQFIFFMAKEYGLSDSEVWFSTLYAVTRPMKQKAENPLYWSNEKLFFMGCIDRQYLEATPERLEDFSSYYLDQLTAA